MPCHGGKGKKGKKGRPKQETKPIQLKLVGDV